MKVLPKEQQEQTRRQMQAAFKLCSAEEGEKRLEQICQKTVVDLKGNADHVPLVTAGLPDTSL